MPRWVANLVLIAVPLLLIIPGVAAPSSTTATAHRVLQSRELVVDGAAALDERQEQSAIFDAYRLNMHGIPIQVVTEPIVLNQAQAEARAHELRIGHGVESAPGADDGILIYASVDRWDQRNVVVSISVGGKTLPRNGLDADALERIRRTIVADQVADGRVARAIVYSLREMIYLEQYTPPPDAALTGWRSDLNRVLGAAPLLAVGGGAWLVRTGMSAAMPIRSVRIAAAITLLAATLIVLAVIARSPAGAGAGVLLGAVAVWWWICLDGRSQAISIRRVEATPRPPGRRRPASAR